MLSRENLLSPENTLQYNPENAITYSSGCAGFPQRPDLYLGLRLSATLLTEGFPLAWLGMPLSLLLTLLGCSTPLRWWKIAVYTQGAGVASVLRVALTSRCQRSSLISPQGLLTGSKKQFLDPRSSFASSLRPVHREIENFKALQCQADYLKIQCL